MAHSLVVNADDLGVTRGATLGIVEAHQQGIVTSASLAVTTDAYGHAVDLCLRTCPDLGVGLHFTLTSGRPASPARSVPLLVDASGVLKWRFGSLLAAVMRPGSSALLEEVDVELEAQFARLLADGVQPDHVDGERHVHLIPGIFERVVAAARRHGVPFVRAGREAGGALLTLPQLAGRVASGGFVTSAVLSSLGARARRHLGGVQTADHFASYLYSGRPDLFLEGMLRRPPFDGVTEVMVHPGLPEQSGGASLGNADLERYVASPNRRRERDVCIAARQWVGTWPLTTFGRLAREGGAR